MQRPWFHFLILMIGIGLSPARNFGAEIAQWFQKGNQFYQMAQYDSAMVYYQKILQTGYESGVLYYNLGNCYYKTQQLGLAILYYERAKKWMPNDPDLKNNLAIANLRIVDKIEPASSFVLIRWTESLLHLFPRPWIRWATVGFYILGMGFLIFWILSRNLTFRRWALRIAISGGVLFLLSGLLWIGQAREAKTKRSAIVLSPKVEVFSAPSEQGGVEIFSLHEGTKVDLDREQGEWQEIILPDRKVGWVKKEVLGVI